MFKTLNNCVCIGRDVTLDEARLSAGAVNEATGRAFESGTGIAAASSTFFSFQWLASRFQTLAFYPIWQKPKIHAPEMRKAIAWHLYCRPLIGLAQIYILAWLAGWRTEWDSRSSDFGKIRKGKLHLDPMLGLSQIIVFTTRLSLGIASNFFPEIKEYKSSSTGEVKSITGGEFAKISMDDVIKNFERSKLHPMWSIIWNLASHFKPGGEPTSPAREIWTNSHPITYGDIYEAFTENENMTDNAAASFVDFLGWGLQVYDEKQKKKGKLEWWEPWE